MHTSLRDTTPSEAKNKKITDMQRQALYKFRQMAEILKGDMYLKKSHYSCIVAKIKYIIEILVKGISLPVFSFKQTQKSALHNSKILATFDGNLGESIKSQKRIPLDFGS